METHIQELITQADARKAGAPEQLLAALYAELHRLADQQLRASGQD